MTNNHYGGKAAVDASLIQAAILGEPAEVPPTLLEAFPDELGPVARQIAGPERVS